MPQREFISTVGALVAFAAPGPVTTGTPGSDIDTTFGQQLGFFVTLADVEAAESVEIKLQHRDTGGTYEDVPANLVVIVGESVNDRTVTTPTSITVTDAEGDGVYKIAYVGQKAECRLFITPTGGDGVGASAIAIVGGLYNETEALSKSMPA